MIERTKEIKVYECKEKTITFTQIGPTDIAELLSHFKGPSPILSRRTLVDKAKIKFKIGKREAMNLVDYLDAANYLSMEISITKDQEELVTYQNTSKAEKLIQKYL